MTACKVLLLFTRAVVSFGRKIVQDHHASMETDSADKEFGMANLQRFEAKAMELLAHLESQVENQSHGQEAAMQLLAKLESKINSSDAHRNIEQGAPQIVTIPQPAMLTAASLFSPLFFSWARVATICDV